MCVDIATQSCTLVCEGLNEEKCERKKTALRICMTCKEISRECKTSVAATEQGHCFKIQ
uniref:Uncharacterized protein n=1 Tax=Octopus bimaculoides TaxID=37653 RepID=A0A0L8HW23_OCTBM